jgi:DNA-binding transcriptional MerR regulator
MEAQLTVAEIAKHSGVAVSHIRYYERAGLLPTPDRAGRQIRYPVAVLDRLRVIAEAREAGLTLSEIRELSELGVDLRLDLTGRHRRSPDQAGQSPRRRDDLEVQLSHR